jgi:hypothetical protein
MSGTLAVGDNLPRRYRNHTLELQTCLLNPLLLRRPYRFFVSRKFMIYQLEAERQFPSRVHIGLRAVGWVESEVQNWLANRIDSHRARQF